jgi:hypothetical protein
MLGGADETHPFPAWQTQHPPAIERADPAFKRMMSSDGTRCHSRPDLFRRVCAFVLSGVRGDARDERITIPASANAQTTVANLFGYGRGGTSPRLMMSYLLLSASINEPSALCVSLKPASSARNWSKPAG